MPSWFDVKELDRIEKTNFSEQQFEESAKRIAKVVENEIKLIGNSKKIVIGGFSQGAAMACTVGLEYPKPLGGILMFSGFYSYFIKPSMFNLMTPVFVHHGLQD